jgi:hypothetical protein
MGSHFDVVISCDLREDTPEEVINIIRFLTDSDYELVKKPIVVVEHSNGIWEGSFDSHFLAPDPKHEVISSFQKMWRTYIPSENDRKVYRYSLQYSGRNIHDDFWAECHIPFIYWLASYVYEDFIGYMRETTNSVLDLIYVHDGKLVGDKFNSPTAD